MEDKNNIENGNAPHGRPKKLDRQHLISDEVTTSKYDGSNEVTSQETEQPPDEEDPPKTSLFAMFRFADGLDVLMLLVGTICAMINGFSWPFMLVIFAETIQDFVDFALYEKFLEKIPGFLNSINMTFDDAREDIGDFLPYCGMLADYQNATHGNITCDNLESTKNLFDEMDDKVLVYLVGSLVVMVAAFGQVYLFIISAERQIIRMRLAFYRAIVRQEMGWLDSKSPGELAVKLTDDIGKIHEAIGDKGATAIQFYTASFSSVVACFVFGWELTLILQIASPFIFFAFAAIGILLAKMTTLERDSYSKAGAIAEEAFSSIRTVQAFGGQEKEVERYVSNLAEAKKYGINKSLVLGIGWGVSWCAMFFNWGVGFWYGGKLVRDGDYSVKDMMSVFLQALLGVLALGLAAPSAIIVNTGRAAAYAVFEILDRQSKIDSLSAEGLKPTSLTGNLRLRNVHFTYPCRENVKILQGLDLNIKAGQTVALVGASGCGKSTVIQLLLRFYDPDQGQVCLDGVDIRDINTKWLRQKIGLVGQEPVLFAMSIKENIRYGRDGVTDEEIVKACKNANAYNFIMNMPDKFDTHVGERGAQLSGGQKQRIAIARALVKNPKVLLLDEATSALDTESEVVVQDALERASKGRTTVVIAHRLSTVRNADVIVALDKGEVVESGTHDELMADKGHYFNLVSLQLQKAKKDEDNTDEQLPKETERRKSRQDDFKVAAQIETNKVESKVGNEEEEEEEDADYPLITNPVWRLILENKPEWSLIIIGCIASLINGSIQPVWSVILAEVVKAFSNEDKSEQKDKMNEMALMVAGLGIVSLIAFFFQEYMFGLSGEALTLRMRRKMFNAMLRQNIAWYDDPRHETGILSTRLATETSVVQGTLKTLASSVLISLGNLGTGLVISFIFGWQLALVLMVFVPVIILSGMITMRVMGGAYNEGKAVMEDVSKGAMASIDNIRTVAALTREETFAKLFSDRMWAPHKVNTKKSVPACAAFGVTQGMYYVTFAVCFYYGAELLKDDDIEYYDIFKVFGCIILSAMHLGRVVAFAPDANSARKAARKIFALDAYTPPIDAYSKAGEKPDKNTYQAAISFSGAQFRYPMRPDAKILNGLDLRVDPGQTLALVGESGCGKSTTMQLIERFYDADAGSVYLDRFEIRNLNIEWLRSQIGLVSQEPVLFDLSIAENIAYGDNSREVTMTEIVQAAKSANIHNFIANLPDAYNTSVGAKGTQLSGGQKQRIAIARALIRKPKILLLDEATSALDTESEKIVQEALDKAREGRTCITIAHRLSTIKDADKIAVFKAGSVCEIGTHEELMERKGLYYMLQTAQAKK